VSLDLLGELEEVMGLASWDGLVVVGGVVHAGTGVVEGFEQRAAEAGQHGAVEVVRSG
jgi:hypothetical protein